MRIVKNQPERMSVSAPQPAHAVPHVHPVNPARALHRPVMDREDHAFALDQRNDLGARLQARALLGENEFAAREVMARP